VLRCTGCGLLYVGQIEDGEALIDRGPVLGNGNQRLLVSNDLRDIQGSWELAGLPAKEAERPALRLNAGEALDRLARYARPPGRLLDFGCGWGYFLGAAVERGWEPLGVEPLPAHAVYARATFGAQVLTDVLRDGSFPPGYFDAITSFQVFEHLMNPLDDLRKLCSFAKAGALILIEVPNIDTFTFRILRSRHRHFVPDHVNFFSPRTLSALMERAGLHVLETYYPTRNLTLGHLASHWGARFLPAGAAKRVDRMVTGHGLRSRIVSLNLHDIIAAIARKPGEGERVGRSFGVS
jgi:SAM-dependent methyltransferase